MAIVADRVAETTTTTGTGTYSLLGASLAHQSFVAGAGTASVVRYCAYDGTDWEIGEGTVTDLATDTLTRTTIYSSSNAGSAVNWTAGTRDIVLVNDADSIQSVLDHLGLTNNPHAVTATQVGLGSVDNTTDANKPVSTAQQTALDLKLDASAQVLHPLVETAVPAGALFTDTIYTLDKPKVEAVLIGEIASHTHASDNGYAFVWAEENASLSVGSIFSFGNGATGGGQKFTVPVACTAKVLTINTSTSTTGVIELYVNGVATGETLTLSANTKATANINYSIAQGDAVSFYCVSGSGGGNVVVGVGLLMGTVAVQGTTGDSAYDAWISEGNVGTVADFLIDITGSDATVTKVAVEAVLTGVISSHSHAGGSAATETAAGIVELATQAEVDAGTDVSRSITPATLASWSGANTTPYEQNFVATNAQTNFTLTNEPVAAWIWQNGAAQDASVWSIVGNDIVLNVGATTSDTIKIYYLSGVNLSTSQAAVDISYSPFGNITSTNVQDAINELENVFNVTLLDTADIGVTVQAAGSYQVAGSYEPADGTILKDADIGVTVQAAGSYQPLGDYLEGTDVGTLVPNIDGDTAQAFKASRVSFPPSSSKTKIRLWEGTDAASIGFSGPFTYGYLNDSAITSQMSNTPARGWWWGGLSDTTSEGSMSLSVDGKLFVDTLIDAPSILESGVNINTIYEPIDGTILKDVDIGVNVQAFDTTILKDADIGVNVQAYVAPITTTDNAITKANGTAGIIQDTGVIIDDNNNISGAGTLANVQTGTTYAIVATDAGKLITLNNAAATTITIPANASIAFPIGTMINLLSLGAGIVTVAITTDTLQSKDSNVNITGQYSGASLVKIAATTWVLFGDLAA